MITAWNESDLWSGIDSTTIGESHVGVGHPVLNLHTYEWNTLHAESYESVPL